MSKEEQKISDFYHAQYLDKPSDELDMKVLAEARQTIVVKSQWRKWQWPASVAASIMFVSVILFTQYSGFSPNINDIDLSSSAKVDPFALADDATLDADHLAFNQKQRRQQEAEFLANRKTQERQAIADAQRFSAAKEYKSESSSTESLSQPELTLYAQKEVATLGARALDGIEIDILPLELDESAPLDTGMKKETEKELLASRMAPAQIQNPARRQMASSDYLDELLDNYANIKSKIDQLTATKSVERASLNAQLVDIQKTVFDYLVLQKLVDPNLKIQSKYLDILQQQQKSLFKDQVNE